MGKIYKLSIVGIIIFFSMFVIVKNSMAIKITENTDTAVLKGNNIIYKSGCIKCHSFVKGLKIDHIISLADWGDKKISVKQTEKDIRACKADIYCRQILTDKQVRYVAVYLNSLKN